MADPGDLVDAALDALGGSVAGKGAADKIAEVGEAALRELLKRFKDPKSAAELPGTGLLNIAAAVVRIKEKEAANAADAQNASKSVDEIEVILSSPQSPARKRELLGRALVRIEERRQKILDLLEGDTL